MRWMIQFCRMDVNKCCALYVLLRVSLRRQCSSTSHIKETTKSIQSFFSLIYVMDMLFDSCCLLCICSPRNWCECVCVSVHWIDFHSVRALVTSCQGNSIASFAYINYDLDNWNPYAKSINSAMLLFYWLVRKQTSQWIETVHMICCSHTRPAEHIGLRDTENWMCNTCNIRFVVMQCRCKIWLTIFTANLK